MLGSPSRALPPCALARLDAAARFVEMDGVVQRVCRAKAPQCTFAYCLCPGKLFGQVVDRTSHRQSGEDGKAGQCNKSDDRRNRNGNARQPCREGRSDGGDHLSAHEWVDLTD